MPGEPTRPSRQIHIDKSRLRNASHIDQDSSPNLFSKINKARDLTGTGYCHEALRHGVHVEWIALDYGEVLTREEESRNDEQYLRQE